MDNDGIRHGVRLPPLHAAADDSNIDDMERILEIGLCDVNSRDHSHRSALHCLFNAKNFKGIEEFKRGILVLKKYGCDVNAMDHTQHTPLHLVFSNFAKLIPDVLTFCFRTFPEYNHLAQSHNGYTIFHMLTSDLNDGVKDCDDFEDIVGDRERFIQNFLMGKIIEISGDRLQLLLRDKDNSGISAFHTYIDGNYYTMDNVKLMIQCGADVNEANTLGITPLMQAVIRDRYELVDILLQSGVDPNATDLFQQTALFRVTSVKTFQLLCDYGAKLDVHDRFGKSPVMDVRMFIPENLPRGELFISSNLSKKEALATLFFERGISPDIVDRYGATLLHYAAWWSHVDPIDVLLKHNARKDIRDNYGRTAYDLAECHCNFSVTKTLLPENYDINQEALHNYQETTKYIRVTFYHEDINDMEKCLRILNFQENPHRLVNLLINSPLFGMTQRKVETQEIKTSIETLMTNIAAMVGEMDNRFTSRVVHTGSSSEGTMISDPCEFDFVFCLDEFSKEYEVLQPDSLLYSGFALLKMKNDSDQNKLASFANYDGILKSDEICNTFQDLVVATLNKPDLWNHENIYFDGLLEFPADKPVLRLTLEWNGHFYKNITINIDMVPGVRVHDWRPRELLINIEMESINDIQQFFLLFHGPIQNQDDSENYLRISSAPSEIYFFKNSEEFIRECYSLTKILKFHSFCPSIQFDDSNSSADDESLKTDSSDSYDSDEENVVVEQEETKDSISSESNSGHSIDSDSPDKSGFEQVSNSNLRHKVYGWAIKVDEAKRPIKLYTAMKDTTTFSEKDQQDVATSNVRKPSKPIICQDTVKYIFGNKGTTSKDNISNSCDKEHISDVPSRDCIPVSSSCFFGNPVNEENLEERSNTNEALRKTEELCKNCGSDDDNQSSIDSANAALMSCEHDVQDDTDWRGGDLLKADDVITSYMLKNCLMYILSEKENPLSHSLLEMAIEVYEYLLRCAEKRCLFAFYLPFINIFSYVDEHIKCLSKEKVEKEVHKRCYQISCFCKVILGILKSSEEEAE